MRKLYVIAGACICISFIGCSTGENQTVYDQEQAEKSATAIADTTTYNEISSIDSKKIVRSASLKAMVNDVSSTTVFVEHQTKLMGGFVRSSKLHTQSLTEETVQVSKDSSKTVATKSITCDMELRVPNVLLDSLLKMISASASSFDYRIVEAENISLQLKEGELMQRRLAVSQNRLTSEIDDKGKKLLDINQAENALLDKQTARDNALLTGLQLSDKVSYSTIKLELYQLPIYQTTMQVYYTAPEQYEPGFIKRVASAFLVGWDIVLDILVGITKIWWLILIVVVLFPYMRVRLHKLNKP